MSTLFCSDIRQPRNIADNSWFQNSSVVNFSSFGTKSGITNLYSFSYRHSSLFEYVNRSTIRLVDSKSGIYTACWINSAALLYIKGLFRTYSTGREARKNESLDASGKNFRTIPS